MNEEFIEKIKKNSSCYITLIQLIYLTSILAFLFVVCHIMNIFINPYLGIDKNLDDKEILFNSIIIFIITNLLLFIFSYECNYHISMLLSIIISVIYKTFINHTKNS